MGKKTQLIIGIDPGTQKCGIACFRGNDLVNAEVLSAPSSWKLNRRVLNIADQLVDKVSAFRGRTKPENVHVCLETPGSQNRPGRTRALLAMGTGVGAFSYAMYAQGYALHLVPVTEWARLDGGKLLSKEVRAGIMASTYPSYNSDLDKGLDAADGVGVAHYWRTQIWDGE